MRRWTTSLAAALLLIASGQALAVRLVKTPYLQRMTTDGVTVMWESDVESPGIVEFGKPGQRNRKAEATESKRIQQVRLTGLEPETVYEYRVVVDDAKAGPYTFRTAVRRDTPFRFAAYGDNRTFPETHAKVVAGMAKHKPDFVINTGDLVTHGDKYHHWGREYFAPLAPLHRSVPVFPCLGNHEASGKLYCLFFDLPDPEWYYHFDYGNARFAVIDSYQRKPGWFAPDSEQGQWMVQALRSGEATWKFAVFHNPPYSSHPKRGCSLIHQQQICPTLEAHGVDVVFNGHNHYYERVYPMRGGKRDDESGVHYVVTGGGGAPIYPALTDWFTAAHRECHHYCIIDVDGAMLRLTAYDVDHGGVIDRFGLCKDPALLERLAKEAADASAAERAKKLAELGTVLHPKTPALLARFAEDPDVATRRAVARGLGGLAMRAGRATALALCEDKDAGVRAGAALAVGRTSSSEDAKVIAELLQDADPAVRANAAWFFIHVQGPEVVPLVRIAIADESAAVRRRAIRGLGAASGEDIVPILRKAIADEDGEVALPAIQRAHAIGKAAELIDPLLTAAKNKEPKTRLAAVKVLAEVDERDKTIPVLIDLADDENPSVQGFVVGLLERWTKQRFGYKADKWKAWWAEKQKTQ